MPQASESRVVAAVDEALAFRRCIAWHCLDGEGGQCTDCNSSELPKASTRAVESIHSAHLASSSTQRSESLSTAPPRPRQHPHLVQFHKPLSFHLSTPNSQTPPQPPATTTANQPPRCPTRIALPSPSSSSLVCTAIVPERIGPLLPKVKI